jgi:hypothetical protein
MAYTSQNTKIRKRISLIDANETAVGALYLTDVDTPPPALTGVTGAVAFGANGRILEWLGGSYADWNLGVGIRKTETIDNSTGTGNTGFVTVVDFSPLVLPAELTCQVSLALTSGSASTGVLWSKTGPSQITLVSSIAAASVYEADIVIY